MKTAKTTMKQFALAAFAGVLTAGTGFAQQSVPGASSEVISYDELNSAEAPDIIFSNLEQPSEIASTARVLFRLPAGTRSGRRSPRARS